MKDQHLVKQLRLKPGKEEYGLDLKMVQAILCHINLGIHQIGDASRYIEGAINLEDKEVLLVDIRQALFTAPLISKTRRPSSLLRPGSNVGLVVEAATGTISLSAQKIHRPSTLWPNLSTRYLVGLGRYGRWQTDCDDCDDRCSIADF